MNPQFEDIFFKFAVVFGITVIILTIVVGIINVLI